MPTPTLRRIVLVTAAAALGLATIAPGAMAAPVEVESWDALPSAVTTAQTVWEPTYTVGQDLHATTYVEAKKCKGQAGYLVDAFYSNGTAMTTTPELSIEEQPAQHCADRGYTWYGLVKTLKIPNATVQLFGQCGWDAANNAPVEGFDPDKGCPKSSIKATGGLLLLTQTRKTSAKQMGYVAIETTRVSYAQLVRVAKGLKLIK